jgi:flagellar biosynthesis/type III secretory pathway protein FliH
MAVHDFTFERQLKLTARDSREEGRIEGHEAGRIEGHEAGRIEGRQEGRIEGCEESRRQSQIKAVTRICRKHQKEISAADAAEMLEEDEAFVRAIYELADEYAPDYDVEAMYKVLKNQINS